jgi:hypothetical protein
LFGASTDELQGVRIEDWHLVYSLEARQRRGNPFQTDLLKKDVDDLIIILNNAVQYHTLPPHRVFYSGAGMILGL